MLTTLPINEQTYVDTPTTDGTYYYGVVGIDSAGNLSPLSNVISIIYDRSNPDLTIHYDRNSPVGTGLLNITLVSNEPLLQTPSLTLTPANSQSPHAIILNAQDETTYVGSLDISPAMNNGLVSVLAIATDKFGNKVTTVPANAHLELDTRGPVATIQVNPVPPVQIQTSTQLTVNVSLDEPVKVGSLPILTLTTPDASTTTIPLIGSDNNWNGTTTLTSTAGDGFGSFTFESEDALGNIGTSIISGNTVEFYTGTLPTSPATPVDLIAQTLPGGQIDLSWSAADNAESYNIYRRAGDCSIAPGSLIASGVITLSSIDTPANDGSYCYGVTSSRRGAESALSSLVQVISDRVAPNAAQNLTVSLQNNGVDILWQASAGEVPALYQLYRNGELLRTLNGGQANYVVTDHPGTGGIYSYSVVVLDAAGNSVETVPVNFSLLVGAVSNLEVIVMHGEAPSLAWVNNDQNVVGYEVYIGTIKQHAGLLTSPSFQDFNYAGTTAVTYRVVSVDNANQRSPVRLVTVYPVEISALANVSTTGLEQPLLMNNFSRFSVNIKNLSSDSVLSIDEFSSEMSANAVVQYTDLKAVNQTIAALGEYQQDIIIPIGNTDVDHLLFLSATHRDSSGTTISYQRPVLFQDIRQPVDMVSLSLNDVPLSGGITTVQLCVRNAAYTAIDIVAARDKGNLPGDIYASILDSQGLEVARGEYKGIPAGAVLRGTDVIVTLIPDQQLCVDIHILVPAGLDSGTQLQFIGSISEIQNIDGNTMLTAGSGGLINGSMLSAITLSTYYGTAQTSQAIYSNNDVVTITGQAINRLTGQPEINAPIKLGFEVKGYTWFEALTTDNIGNYSFDFTPALGLSGQFNVWAAHPDVYATLNQASFSFYRLYAIPAKSEIRMSKADTLNFEIDLYNPGEDVLDNVSLNFRAYTIDAAGTEIEETTVQGTLSTPVDWTVAPDQSALVQLSLAAAIDAPTHVNVEYTITTNQGASATFTGLVTLSDAIPLLTINSPATGYVDTSLNRGSTKTVPVTVTNTGLRDLQDAVLTLPTNVTWISTPIADTNSTEVLLGTIAVGKSITFDVLMTPPTDTTYGYHQDSFSITGSNAQQAFIINTYALVSSSQVGSVNFNVFNILGQQVPNARVRLWNSTLQQEISDQFTNANGQLLVSDLKLGDWGWQVIASGHSSATGTILIEAGLTVEETVELSKSLVTINFNVVPVPFTDSYEIVIEQQFDTHVPIPVLVVKPPLTTFANPVEGLEVIVPVEVSNFGLKALEDVTIVGTSAAWGSLQPLVNYMPSLGAMETVTIPFKFTYDGANNVSLPQGVLGDIAGGAVSNRKGKRAGEITSVLTDAAFEAACGAPPGGLEFNSNDIVNGLWALMSGGYRSIYEDIPRTITSGLGVKILITPCEFDVGGIPIPNPACTAGIQAAWDAGVEIGHAIKCLAEAIYDGDKGNGNGNSATTRSGGGGGGAGGGGGPGCFIAGTPIQMADGYLKRIEDVVMGDQVLGFDGQPAAITKVYTRETDHLRELRYRDLDSGQQYLVETTDEHHYWVQNKQSWMLAGVLIVGDVLALPDGQFAEVVFTQRHDAEEVVYNFDVEGLQSYYANRALVYQQCGAETDPLVTQNLLGIQSNALKSNKEKRAIKEFLERLDVGAR